MDLHSLVDAIPAESFIEGPDGLSRTEISTVHDKMRELFPNGYSWNVKQAGRHANGIAFFVGELTIMLPNGVHTVVGTAEGRSPNMGLSGVATTAFMNACLRGLGMAQSIYNEDKHTEEQEVVNLDTPLPPQPQPSYQNNGQNRPAFQQRQFPGSRPANGGGGYRSGASSYSATGNSGGNWDGSKVIGGSGPFAGRRYDSIDTPILQKWASGPQPNPNAIKELNRRMAEQGMTPSDPNPFGG